MFRRKGFVPFNKKLMCFFFMFSVSSRVFPCQGLYQFGILGLEMSQCSACCQAKLKWIVIPRAEPKGVTSNSQSHSTERQDSYTHNQPPKSQKHEQSTHSLQPTIHTKYRTYPSFKPPELGVQAVLEGKV